MRDKLGHFIKGHSVPKKWRKDSSERMMGSPGHWLGKKRPDMTGEKNFNYKGGKCIQITCLQCDAEFSVFPYRKDDKFCSKKCADLAKIGAIISEKTRKKISNALQGEQSYLWKGGRRKHTSGYILIYSPKHPNKNKHGAVFEHRLVSEKQLKRYLTKFEIIHHINGIKTDNRPENLYLFPSNSEHVRYDNSKNKQPLKSNLIQ